jgi:hypothetical protein
MSDIRLALVVLVSAVKIKQTNFLLSFEFHHRFEDYIQIKKTG